MRHDPFLKVKAADPDEVIVSKAAPFLSPGAPVQIGGVSVPHTAAAPPPGPKIAETDLDADDAVGVLWDQSETYSPDGVHIPGGVVLNSDEAVFRSVEVEVEKKWSDEARAAAALARENGYKPVKPTRNGPRPASRYPGTFTHPEGHSVTIDPQGGWTHEHPINGTKLGHGPDELRQHMRHGATYKGGPRVV